MTDQAITIQDVGPIEAVSIPIPEGGGVVVLRGANGSGKSTALDAVDTMSRGASSLSARARHGQKRGKIEGLGTKVSVGLQRATRAGQLEVGSFDARANVAELVDPGLKDPAAADRKRIAMACALAGIEPDPERFRGLAEDLDDSLFSGDLVDVAAKVRTDLQRRAREHETRAVQLAERAKTLQGECAVIEGAPDAEQAQAELEAAIAASSALSERKREAGAMAKRAAAAQAKLDEIGESAPDLQALKGAAEAATATHSDAERLVADLAGRLEEARRDAGDSLRAERAAWKALEDAEVAAKDREAAAKVVAESLSAAAPSDAEAAAAADRVAEARRAVGLAAEAERAAAKAAQAHDAEADAAQESQRATGLRDAASRTDDVLAEHLASVMPQGLRVIDGRLVVDESLRMVPFSDLSDGERWRIALDIAIEALGGAGLVAIEQPAWEGLDGDARRSIAEHARERGVVIVTAEADHGAVVGSLRAEVFGDA